MNTKLDVPYSAYERNHRKLDIFFPEKSNGCAILFIHGGGFSGGGRISFHAASEYFAARGFVCVSAGYHLSDAQKFPAQIIDVRLAMQYLKNHAGEWGVDKQKITICGSSAGGMLVSLLSTIAKDDTMGDSEELVNKDTKPALVIALCSVFSIMKDGYYSPWLMGFEQEENESAYREASARHRLDGTQAPYQMILGSEDRSTPVEKHQDMKEALEAKGGSAELHIIKGAGHGDFYGNYTEQQKECLALMDIFLKKHLF